MAHLVVKTPGACRDMHVLTLKQSHNQVSYFAHMENKTKLYASLQKLNCGFCVLISNIKNVFAPFCFVSILDHDEDKTLFMLVQFFAWGQKP